jgi:hypothetical protein
MLDKYRLFEMHCDQVEYQVQIEAVRLKVEYRYPRLHDHDYQYRFRLSNREIAELMDRFKYL